MTDIGNRCVHCGENTAFGSGRFVNRIQANADYEALDDKGNVIFAEGEYRDGYSCAKGMALPCDDNGFKQDFSDGSWRVHYECLTAEEKIEYERRRNE